MEKHLTLSGTPGVGFTVEASQDNGTGLDDPKEFEINERNTVSIFQFIPPKDISKTQLDITVTSDSDIPSYLKVSRNCQDVKDNIRLVDYRGESIRLTFARKGRITLSKASIPSLADSASWYIGISLNNAKGTTPLNATKTGTLTLKKSFSYSYAGPMSFICLVPFFGGGIAVVWALICFKEPHVHPCQSSNSPVTWGEVCTAMGDVIKNYWFAGGHKTFSYITCIVGCVLLVGAFQFVYADWYLMIQEGDRDHCYYNDFCYRVSSSDIPFNLMSSNFAYIMHAFILALSVLYMEAEVLARCKKWLSHPPPSTGNDRLRLPDHVLICPDISPHLASMSVPDLEVKQRHRAEAHKRKFSFSIGYAFAWALLFEGLFSTLYHLCPSKITFQFDTAFMFIISGLIVVVMYNGIKIRSCPEDGEARGNVGAPNFFLAFIVPLYILNYLGSLNHSKEGLIPTVAWAVPLALWCFIIVNWVGYKLYFEDWKWYSLLLEFICKWKCNSKCIGLKIGVSIAVGLLCFMTITDSLPQALLITCIAESVFVIMMKVCYRNCSGREWECECDCECNGECCCKCECFSWKCFFTWMTWIYVLITIAVLVVAFVIFKAFPTTDKANTPEKSRNENHECIWLGFFDYHDIWHILSSFGLLMGAHLLMYVSYTAPSNASGESSFDRLESRQQRSEGIRNPGFQSLGNETPMKVIPNQ